MQMMYFFPSSFGLKTYTCVTLCLKLKQRSLFCQVFCGSETIASEECFSKFLFFRSVIGDELICKSEQDLHRGLWLTLRFSRNYEVPHDFSPLLSFMLVNRILRVLSEDCICNSTIWCIGCLFFLYNIGTALPSSSNAQPGSPLLKEIVFLRSERLVIRICLFFLEKIRSPCLYVVSISVTIFEVSFFLI